MVSNFLMEDERRAVLERVARGELSPAEAAALLEEMESKTAGAGPTTAEDPRDWAADWGQPPKTEPGSTPPPPGSRAKTIRVVRTIGTAQIIGDPSVQEAVADGPHVARRDGDTLVIEGQDDGFEMPGFYFNWRGRQRRRHRHRHPFPFGDVAPLSVRVNPDLPLEVDAQASRLHIRGVHGPIRATVQAGSPDIADFRSPLDLTVQAGSVNAHGRLDHGASRIRCDAGGVRLRLERGSSVRVSARTTLGKVVFDTEDSRTPWVIGAGEGTLDIDGTMGSVR